MINCYYCPATCQPNELGQYIGWGELSHSEPDDNTGHAVDVFGYICPDCADIMLEEYESAMAQTNSEIDRAEYLKEMGASSDPIFGVTVIDCAECNDRHIYGLCPFIAETINNSEMANCPICNLPYAGSAEFVFNAISNCCNETIGYWQSELVAMRIVELVEFDNGGFMMCWLDQQEDQSFKPNHRYFYAKYHCSVTDYIKGYSDKEAQEIIHIAISYGKLLAEMPVIEPCPYCQEPLFCINCNTPIETLTKECPNCRRWLECSNCNSRIDPNHKRCEQDQCTACKHTGITYHRNPNTDQMESRHCGYCYSPEFAVTEDRIYSAIANGKSIEQSMIRKSNATMIYGHKWLGNTLFMDYACKCAVNFYEHNSYMGYMLTY